MLDGGIARDAWRGAHHIAEVIHRSAPLGEGLLFTGYGPELLPDRATKNAIRCQEKE